MVTFRHGVASADPLPDGILLWTRCTTGGEDPVEVDWWIGPTRDPVTAVAGGTVEASAEGDFTVHVDVRGLEAGTTYWYGFSVGEVESPVGRTRTAPVGGDRLRIGLTSCASWPCGFFNAYRNLAARDLDLVVHVGDYIYETDMASRRREAPRVHRPGGTPHDLVDYRARYAQYRLDPDLQALHARHPVAAVWDDHEFAGGAWRDGAANHNPRRQGPWADRRAAASRAYREWIPVRSPSPGTVHRTLHLGPLGDLVLLDTRLIGRDRPANNGVGPTFRVSYGNRSLLGEQQWRWLAGEVSASTAKWLLVGNQVMMAPLRVLNIDGGLGVNSSQWDGYPAERERFYSVMRDGGRSTNVAVLTGDLHSSWGSDLPVGAEFVTPSVTTDSFADTLLPPVPGAAAVARRIFLASNRHVRLADIRRHGYVVVEVTDEAVQADWWHLATIARRDPAERWAGGWRLLDGRLGLVPASAPASVRSVSPPR